MLLSLRREGGRVWFPRPRWYIPTHPLSTGEIQNAYKSSLGCVS